MITGASTQCRGPRHREPPARDHIGAASWPSPPGIGCPAAPTPRHSLAAWTAPAPTHYVQLPGFSAAWNGLWNETADAWALRALWAHGRDRNLRLTATTAAASRLSGHHPVLGRCVTNAVHGERGRPPLARAAGAQWCRHAGAGVPRGAGTRSAGRRLGGEVLVGA